MSLIYVDLSRDEESVEQQEQGLKEDPIDLTGHVCLSRTLFFAGGLAHAQAEVNRILEFEENYVYAMMLLSHIYARQEKRTDALRVAEKAFPMIPMAMGTLAGVLRRTGAVNESEELTQKLM